MTGVSTRRHMGLFMGTHWKWMARYRCTPWAFLLKSTEFTSSTEQIRLCLGDGLILTSSSFCWRLRVGADLRNTGEIYPGQGHRPGATPSFAIVVVRIHRIVELST